MVLLDEAHSYGGTHGAQVAYLIRRWRHAIGRYGRPHFTGLSATLTNASTFFAALTGIPEYAITSIRADQPQWPRTVSLTWDSRLTRIRTFESTQRIGETTVLAGESFEGWKFVRFCTRNSQEMVF